MPGQPASQARDHHAAVPAEAREERQDLARGLSRQDAVRFSFLLSAPVILAAGVFKAKELFSSEASGILPQILVGSLVAGVAAYFTLKFLDRFLSNPKRTLTPFAIYCVIMGLSCLFYL